MNIKRAFLTAAAVLIMPGFAMAQSTVTFDVGANFFGEGDDPMVMAYLNCNSGLPLTNEFMVGGPDRVTFTVTEFTPGSCTVSFGDTPDGFQIDGVSINGSFTAAAACIFNDNPQGVGEAQIAADNMCTIEYEVAPADFNVIVNWEISEDADAGVGVGAMVEIYCEDANGSTSTTMPAGPNAPMPVTVTGLVPEGSCDAMLTNVGSAVDANSCSADIEFDGGDAGCVITATAFYEGIPTLSQYGMALMALLMLSIGFVGFRRFV